MTKTEDQDAVRRQLLSLGTLTREELTEKWKDLFGRTPPNYGTLFMRKRLAWRIQELFYGGIPEPLQRVLHSGGDPLKARAKRSMRPGTILMRLWHGARHEVTVRQNGFEYRGLLYRSLSAVAKEITGAHWNGKRFFQLAED